MLKVLLTSIALGFILYSCTSQRDVSCEEKVKELIKASGFNSMLIGADGVVAWEEVHIHAESRGKEYEVQLYWINEENRNTTLAWLTLNIPKHQLLDITNDIEEPDTLDYHSGFERPSIIKCLNELNQY